MKLAGRILPLALLVGSLAGCSGSDDDNFVSAVVTTIEVSDSVIAVGQGSVIAVDFSFSADDIFNDRKRIFLVVRLAPALAFREGTSEIDGAFSGDDEGVGAQITNCLESGETFLLFNLDRFDLDEAENPAGDADARLNFTVDGILPEPQAIISARADGSPAIFTCGVEFIPEAATAIQVVE